MTTKTKGITKTMYHVGTVVQCKRDDCYLKARPRVFTGSGEEQDRAAEYAMNHEKHHPNHVADDETLYSIRPLKG